MAAVDEARARLDAWRALSDADQGAYFASKVARPAKAGETPVPDPIRLAMLVETCPNGTGPCGCGTGPPRSCGRPDRPSEVRRADCLACVALDWWLEGVEAGW